MVHDDSLTLFESERSYVGEMNYYPTPAWFAQAIVERFFPNLDATSNVIEPCCGDGRFLDALPAGVPHLGIELQAPLAAIAAAKGHNVVIGDVTTVALPAYATHAIGNPPYVSELVWTLLDRFHAAYEDGFHAGFLLPTYMLQRAARVSETADKWSMRVDLVPRNVYPELSKPILFAQFTKNAERRMVGLAFFDEATDVLGLRKRLRAIAETEPSAWRAVVRAALEDLGGHATAAQLYRAVEPVRPTKNPWWKEQIRKVANAHFSTTSVGHYALAA